MRVPATSANMGCGFDSIGVALELWLDVYVSVADAWEIDVKGNEVAGIETKIPEKNLIIQQFLLTLSERLKLPAAAQIKFRFTIVNEIPLARGLGSSASAIVAGIAAAYSMAGYDLRNSEILERINYEATLVEGHPDNVAPAVFGGMQVAAYDNRTESSFERTDHAKEMSACLPRVTIPFPAEDLACLVYVPHAELSTDHARGILPRQYDRALCARNTSKAALLVAIMLCRGPYQPHLKTALDDELHEPHRAPLCSTFKLIKDAAREREDDNALAQKLVGVYLSGAGPATVIFVHPCDLAESQSLLLQQIPQLQDTGVFKHLNVVQHHQLT